MMDFVMGLVGLMCSFVDSALGMGYGVTSASLLVLFRDVPAVASVSVHTAGGCGYKKTLQYSS